MLKDNIFLLEQRLTDKIRLCYERELDETKTQLSDFKKQFGEYQEAVTAIVSAEVRQEVNSIDSVVKQMASRFKDLDKKTKVQMKQEEQKKLDDEEAYKQ